MTEPVDEDKLAELIDEFVAKLSEGEAPDVEEFASRHPELAGALRTMLPAVTTIRSLPSIGDMEESVPSKIDKYKIVRMLGKGGMGIVFEAIHESMDRHVALKVMRPGRNNDVKRFEREIRLVAKMRHENVAMAYDAGTCGRYRYLVMEYLDGRDARRIVEEDGPLSVERAIEVTIEAARALDHAHSLGIIHRDVKPSNLFVESRGTVKLLDLGLACIGFKNAPEGVAKDDLTRGGNLVGTLDYMAPEQLRDPKSADQQVDVFGLGCALHYLLTGAPRFARTTGAADHAMDTPHEGLSGRDFTARFGSRIEGLVRRMTATLPEERLRTMREVIHLLEEQLERREAAEGGPSTAENDGALPVGATRGAAPVAAALGATGWQSVWRRLLGSRPAAAGLVVCGAVLIASAGRAWLWGSSAEQGGGAGGPVPPLGSLAGTIGPSRGARFVLVPAGTFEMGARREDIEALIEMPLGKSRAAMLRSELPRHRVRISRAFEIGVHEVTVGEFREFVVNTNYRTELERSEQGVGWDRRAGAPTRGVAYSWRQPGWPQSDDHPVVNVTWNDAVDYCRWRSSKEGINYRLPTEAEWEYVCLRGRTTAPDESKREYANVADVSWGRENPEADVAAWDDLYPFTAPVGSLAADRYGIHDLTGNVWEWCSDRHSPVYDEREAVDPAGPAEGKQRVARGGAWNSTSLDSRPTSRAGAAYPNDGSYGTGFRLVREPRPQ